MTLRHLLCLLIFSFSSLLLSSQSFSFKTTYRMQRVADSLSGKWKNSSAPEPFVSEISVDSNTKEISITSKNNIEKYTILSYLGEIEDEKGISRKFKCQKENENGVFSIQKNINGQTYCIMEFSRLFQLYFLE